MWLLAAQMPAAANCEVDMPKALRRRQTMVELMEPVDVSNKQLLAMFESE